MVRPLKARIESSTKPASFRVSVCIATWTSCSSATPSAVSMAAGVVPQSSWSFSPMAPAAICSRNGSGAEALPLPRNPRLMGKASAASSMRWIDHSPGVNVVALVPGAGPAAHEGGQPGADGFLNELGADEVDVGIQAARGHDPTLAGDHLGSRAHHHAGIDAGHHVGIARLAHPHDPPVANPDVSFHDAPVVDHDGVGDHRVERAGSAGGTHGLAHPVPQDLASAELRLISRAGEVALDADEKLGVGETDAVAHGGAIEIGVLPTREAKGHDVRSQTASRSRAASLPAP